MKRFALVLFVATFVAADAHAYVVLKNFSGNTQRWGSNSVSWTMSTDVMTDVSFNQLTNALTQAMAVWSGVGCAAVSLSGGGATAFDPGNGIHFTFRQNSWDPSVGDALAYSVSETSAGGTISSNDIVFNAFTAEWSTLANAPGKSDIQGVATHEIGHSLGLGHTRELNATMFFTGGSVELRSLHADDQRGLCFLYPSTTFDDGLACDACESSADCAQGVCLDWGGGHAYCGQDCNGASDCPEHFSCWEINGVATPQCLPDNDYCHGFGSNVATGDFCFGDEVCASGQCLPIGNDAYCTTSCNPSVPTSCGAGFTCTAPGLCLKAGSKPYGEVCNDNSECATANCVFFTLQGVCSQPCGSGVGACPNGNQCFEDAACVPPGDRGVGAACGSATQCAGTWCVEGLCTQPCGSGCPSGTSCSGGFCVGAEIGAACAEGGICPEGLSCQRQTASDGGACYRSCDPLTETGCSGAEVCQWRWEAWTEEITGRCVPTNGGAGLGESCATEFCEANLLCRAGAATGPTCHRDCRLFSNSYGCDPVSERCASLEDANDPQRGICVPKDTPVVTPDPGADAGPSDDATSSVPDTNVTVEQGPGADTQGSSEGANTADSTGQGGSGSGGCDAGSGERRLPCWLLVALMLPATIARVRARSV